MSTKKAKGTDTFFKPQARIQAICILDKKHFNTELKIYAFEKIIIAFTLHSLYLRTHEVQIKELVV